MSKQQTAYDMHERIEELQKRRNAVNFGIRALGIIKGAWLLRALTGVYKEEAEESINKMVNVSSAIDNEIVELMGKLDAMKVEEVKGR